MFFNGNAADEEKRREVIAEIRSRFETEPGTVSVLLHSLAFGTLRPYVDPADPKQVLTRAQMEMTLDVMANSLVYWTHI